MGAAFQKARQDCVSPAARKEGKGMMKYVTREGGTIEFRGLKWGEKNQLKKDGFNVVKPDPQVDNDELVSRVVELCVEDFSQLDELDIIDVYELYGEIIRRSFQEKSAEKN
jgi:hypothetical protein